MTSDYFLLLLTVLTAAYLFWGFRVLPRERWQILAVVPVRKEAAGSWAGVNLTWYGLLTANAYVMAVALLFVLLGAIRVPLAATAAAAAVIRPEFHSMPPRSAMNSSYFGTLPPWALVSERSTGRKPPTFGIPA